MSETTIEAREPCEATILAWARLVRAGQAVLAEVEADLKTAGLPPLAWYSGPSRSRAGCSSPSTTSHG
jgi:hypothetical protein